MILLGLASIKNINGASTCNSVLKFFHSSHKNRKSIIWLDNSGHMENILNQIGKMCPNEMDFYCKNTTKGNSLVL